MNILQRLYSEENKYIEELDRLEKHPDDVDFVGTKDGSGWLCLRAKEDSFDWNIARLIGDYAIAESFTEKIPFKECVLLVPNKTAVKVNKKCKAAGSVLFFESGKSLFNDEDSDYLNICCEFNLSRKCIRTRVSLVDARIDDIYILMHNRIVGYCKVSKSCWHYSEIVIEISPSFRGQGYGTALLSMMVQQFRVSNVRLSYLVENDNIASLKIAENAGLIKVFTLDRYNLTLQ